jgi:hypothetical protein
MRVRSGRRAARVAAAIGLTIGSLSLTGCDPIYDTSAPFAVREVDGYIELGACADLSLATVLVETRSPQTDGEWLSLLELEGESLIDSGQILSGRSVPEGFAIVSLEGGGLVPGAEVSALVVGSNGSKRATSMFVTVPRDGIPAGEWLLPDGSIQDSPCR